MSLRILRINKEHQDRLIIILVYLRDKRLPDYFSERFSLLLLGRYLLAFVHWLQLLHPHILNEAQNLRLRWV